MELQTLVIRQTQESDWESVRDLRIEMLGDTPQAFTETADTALGYDEVLWRTRAARGSAAGSVNLAAICDGEWIGMMGAYLPGDGSGAMLVGVYVAPQFRGEQAGVSDALLAGVEDWARDNCGSLTLHVHEQNGRARAFYEKRGFRPTGLAVPYPLDPTELELEMKKSVA